MHYSLKRTSLAFIVIFFGTVTTLQRASGMINPEFEGRAIRQVFAKPIEKLISDALVTCKRLMANGYDATTARNLSEVDALITCINQKHQQITSWQINRIVEVCKNYENYGLSIAIIAREIAYIAKGILLFRRQERHV